MGRVKRYRKIKSCDPFAKNKKIVGDNFHDDPPAFDSDDDDFFQDKKKTKKNSTKSLENGLLVDSDGLMMLPSALQASENSSLRDGEIDIQNDVQEILNRKEAKRILDSAETNKKNFKVEGRRKGESLKEFNIRIRNETRKTLHDVLKSNTKTAQKKKQKLKERGEKLKIKNTGKSDDLCEFSCAQNGSLRPSDLGGIDSFDKFRPKEVSLDSLMSSGTLKHSGIVVVGDSSEPRRDGASYRPVSMKIDRMLSGQDTDKPPDLKSFGDKLAKHVKPKEKNVDMEALRQSVIDAYRKSKSEKRKL